jgi:hypothetical protein
MITTITPLRRVAVTLAMAGVTAFGAVAIAPAAFADETSSVTQPAPTAQSGENQSGQNQSAPVGTPAPVVQAPAPVVTPPAVVIGKDGKPVQAPKTCTDKDIKDVAAKVAKATTQAAPLTKLAAQLRQAAKLVLAQLPKLNQAQAKIAVALANAGDLAASKLEAQAADMIAKAGQLDCLVLTAPGDRF